MLTIEQILDAIKSSGWRLTSHPCRCKKTFKDLGLDSMDVFNILIELQDITGIEIPDADIKDLQSIERSISILKRRCPVSTQLKQPLSAFLRSYYEIVRLFRED